MIEYFVKKFKLRCDERFKHAFTACSCVFKVITMVWVNQRNFFEIATASSKSMRKTLVATQLKHQKFILSVYFLFVMVCMCLCFFV